MDNEALAPLAVESPRKREADLVCGVLVGEMGRAKRWTAVMEAFRALAHVRRMSDQMEAESRHLAQGTDTHD